MPLSSACGIEVVLENVGNGYADSEKMTDLSVISCFQYYRSLRNSIIHDPDSNPEKLEEKFNAIIPFCSESKKQYNSLNAPNRADQIIFDDFILFSRLTKKVAEDLSLMARPSSEHWKEFIDLKPFKKYQQDPKRMRNAISGKIQTEYGIDTATANWIADGILTH